MDIEYLLLLQRFREGAGAALTPVLELITEIAASSLTIGVAAFVFWAVDRRFGSFLVLNYVGNTLLNQAVKLGACVYRPWIRDARITPVPSAIEGATGYSFPSGHTQSATAIYGSVGLWYGRRRRWVAVLAAVLIVLTAFSRNYLGVHTPQDVIVGAALCAGYIWLNGRLMAWVEAKPSRDWIVALGGSALALLAVIWFLCKSYPMDYAGGTLLVDPAVMMEDGFMAAGMVFGFYPGWLVERRFLCFSTERHSAAQFVLAGVALVPMLLLYKLLPGLLAAPAGPLWAEFISCAFLAFYVMAIVPAAICLLQRRQKDGGHP